MLYLFSYGLLHDAVNLWSVLPTPSREDPAGPCWRRPAALTRPDAVNNSGYITSNDRWQWIMTWTGCGRKRPWRFRRLEGLRKITNNFNQHSWCSGRDSNQAPLLEPTCAVSNRMITAEKRVRWDAPPLPLQQWSYRQRGVQYLGHDAMQTLRPLSPTTPFIRRRGMRQKVELSPVPNLRSTLPWRRMGEWMYRSTFSWPRH
jgi:hypothetical protein